MKITFPENIFAPKVGKNIPIASVPAGIELGFGDVYKLIDAFRAKGECLNEEETCTIINAELAGPTKEVQPDV